MSECSICLGERHIQINNQWVRCRCLEEELFNRKLIGSGISFPLSDLTLTNIGLKYPHITIDPIILDFSVKLSNVFRTGSKPDKIVCFQGQADGAKDLIVQTALLGAIKGGLRVNQCSMEQLISNHFTGGEISLEDELTKADVLCLTFGSELQFKVSSSFLQSLVRLNWLHPKNYLLLHTNLRWEDIAHKYGDNIQNLFVKSTGKILDPERRIIFAEVEV